MRWTEEEDEILIEIASTDWTYKQIQEEFFPDRSRNAIQQRCNKVLNISRKQVKRNSKGRILPNNPIGKIDKNKPAKVYLIGFDDNKYKYGCTTIDIKDRLRKSSITDYEIIFYRQFDTGVEAMEFESLWKENVKEYACTQKFLPSGNTETFQFI